MLHRLIERLHHLAERVRDRTPDRRADDGKNHISQDARIFFDGLFQRGFERRREGLGKLRVFGRGEPDRVRQDAADLARLLGRVRDDAAQIGKVFSLRPHEQLAELLHRIAVAGRLALTHGRRVRTAGRLLAGKLEFIFQAQ